MNTFSHVCNIFLGVYCHVIKLFIDSCQRVISAIRLSLACDVEVCTPLHRFYLTWCAFVVLAREVFAPTLNVVFV